MIARAILCALALLVASPVVAQKSKSKTRSTASKADVLRAKGYRLAARHRYKKALPILEEALQLTLFPDSTLLYDLGAISEALGDCSKALLYYTGFLSSMPDENQQIEVTQKIKRCKKATELGTLDISSKPEGQEVRINGVPLGRAPIRGLQLPTGTYIVTSKKEDFYPYKSTIGVEYNLRTRHELRMQKMIFYGTLEVKVTPNEGAIVFLNHVSKGPAPFTSKKLETRRYLVHIEKKGWDRWVRYVTVEKDSVFTVNVNLEKTNTNVAIPPIPR
ncbi:MAG TPA: PEGA domain-containing protein [Myxococcales bacterium]|nr:PEGA domain-containing protein [Myxococcales bacterium]HIN85201.1 PEGA domain-containing protein [Myxococcales bacterium]